MTHFRTALASRIKSVFEADLQEKFRQQNELLRLRLENTLLMEIVPPAVSGLPGTQKRTDAQSFPIIGFNGQLVRAVILLHLMQAVNFDVFVETGTYLAETCVLVAAQTKLPIRSCDLSYRRQSFATVITELLKDRVRLEFLDSRLFLKQFFDDRQFSRPFFYLDAHWETDIPLLEELRIILGLAEEFIIVIDDFHVPGDSGFGFDMYGDTIFNWDYIRSEVERYKDVVSVLYPAYPSILETGAKRGFVMIASNSLLSSISDNVGPDLLKVEAIR